MFSPCCFRTASGEWCLCLHEQPAREGPAALQLSHGNASGIAAVTPRSPFAPASTDTLSFPRTGAEVPGEFSLQVLEA